MRLHEHVSSAFPTFASVRATGDEVVRRATSVALQDGTISAFGVASATKAFATARSLASCEVAHLVVVGKVGSVSTPATFTASFAMAPALEGTKALCNTANFPHMLASVAAPVPLSTRVGEEDLLRHGPFVIRIGLADLGDPRVFFVRVIAHVG